MGSSSEKGKAKGENKGHTEDGREGREVVKSQFLYCSKRGRECRISIDACKRVRLKMGGCKLVPELVEGYYYCPRVPKVRTREKRIKEN